MFRYNTKKDQYNNEVHVLMILTSKCLNSSPVTTFFITDLTYMNVNFCNLHSQDTQTIFTLPGNFSSFIQQNHENIKMLTKAMLIMSGKQIIWKLDVANLKNLFEYTRLCQHCYSTKQISTSQLELLVICIDDKEIFSLFTFVVNEKSTLNKINACMYKLCNEYEIYYKMTLKMLFDHINIHLPFCILTFWKVILTLLPLIKIVIPKSE